MYLDQFRKYTLQRQVYAQIALGTTKLVDVW